MRRIFVGMLLLVVASMAPAMADILVEGIKEHSYQYIIDNSGDYPDYIFLTSSEIWNFEHPSLVINGTFGGGYKLDGFILHAMKKADLDPAVEEKIGKTDQGENNLSSYFASAPLATSDILLPVSVGMNDTIPIRNITVLLKVEGIQEKILNVTKVKTMFGFENGTVREEKEDEEGQNLLSGKNDPDLILPMI